MRARISSISTPDPCASGTGDTTARVTLSLRWLPLTRNRSWFRASGQLRRRAGRERFHLKEPALR
jgi:hypothetical protein